MSYGYNAVMDFSLKVFLSFLIGGGYVSGIVWTSENLGSRIGGAIAGLPSTILVGLIFIEIAEGTEATKSAAKIVPLIFMAALIYAWVFLKSVRKIKGPNKALKASAFALMAWLALVLPEKYIFTDKSFLIICIAASAGLILFRYLFRNLSSRLPKKFELPNSVYFLRFIISGAIIASAVVAAHFAGPVWGGVVSSLPALLFSTLYFLHKTQGDEFLEGFIKRLPVSYISSFIFLVILHQTLGKFGDTVCFGLAMLGALSYTIAIIYFRQPQNSNT